MTEVTQRFCKCGHAKSKHSPTLTAVDALITKSFCSLCRCNNFEERTSNFSCEQCGIWQGREVGFETLEETEEHVMLVHPHRFLTAYRALIGELAHEAQRSSSAERVLSIRQTMKARTG